MKVQLFDDSIEKFIRSLNKSTIAKVLRTIDLLEEFAFKLGMPHSKKAGKGLFELRIRGTQEVRILYTFYQNSVVLLHGFTKKARQIPKKELKIALQKLKLLTSV